VREVRRALAVGLGAISTLMTSVLITPTSIADSVALCANSVQPCRVVRLSDESMYLGMAAVVSVRGNPGVPVTLRAYTVEFNSAGQITDLVPASDPVSAGTTNAAGQINSVTLAPDAQNYRSVGGWLYVGLADDTGIDLRQRTGVLFGFGGSTVYLLGDGYAQQKPIGQELAMDVIGQVRGLKYWVQYQDDDGTWRDVPGQSYVDAQQLTGPENERRQVTYHIPASLTLGKPYKFRVNRQANYGGDVSQPLAKQSFAEWTVIPSKTPVTNPRGKDFDPGAAPGVADVDEPASPNPHGGSSSKPQQVPKPSPTAERTSAVRPSARAETPPTGGAAGSSGATSGKAPATPSASPSFVPNATDRVDAGAVWGQEARGATSEPGAGGELPVSPTTSHLIAVAVLVVLAIPAMWWILTRRKTVEEGLW
jgi:hypothetical protein